MHGLWRHILEEPHASWRLQSASLPEAFGPNESMKSTRLIYVYCCCACLLYIYIIHDTIVILCTWIIYMTVTWLGWCLYHMNRAKIGKTVEMMFRIIMDFHWLSNEDPPVVDWYSQQAGPSNILLFLPAEVRKCWANVKRTSNYMYSCQFRKAMEFPSTIFRTPGYCSLVFHCCLSLPLQLDRANMYRWVLVPAQPLQYVKRKRFQLLWVTHPQQLEAVAVGQHPASGTYSYGRITYYKCSVCCTFLFCDTTGSACGRTIYSLLKSRGGSSCGPQMLHPHGPNSQP